MSEPERANLSLGSPPEGLKQKMAGPPGSRMRLLVLINVAMLACLVVLMARSLRQAAPAAASRVATNAEELKAVALSLEERGLNAQAAAAWEAYLETAPEPAGRAEILYRIGNHYVKADQFGEAAAFFVRSELAAGDDQKIKARIGPKLVECLRRMGRYGELRRELSRQIEVGAEKTGKGKVLARLAGEELTEADLDRMIERQVDHMLTLEGTPADEQRRQAVLRKFSSPQTRQQMLRQLLQAELFSRRARDLKLDRQEEFLQARDRLVESLLADRFLARQLEKIQPSNVDLESFYKANQDRYKQPESIRVVSIRLAAGENVSSVLEKITSADEFHELVRRRRDSKANPGEAPLFRWLARGREDPSLGNTEALFKLSEGQWTKAPHVHNDDKYLVLVEQKTPARTLPLSEVKQVVRSDYLARKQQEVSEELFRDLLTRYDVQITPPEGSEAAESDEAASPSADSAGQPAKSKEDSAAPPDKAPAKLNQGERS